MALAGWDRPGWGGKVETPPAPSVSLAGTAELLLAALLIELPPPRNRFLLDLSIKRSFCWGIVSGRGCNPAHMFLSCSTEESNGRI